MSKSDWLLCFFRNYVWRFVYDSSFSLCSTSRLGIMTTEQIKEIYRKVKNNEGLTENECFVYLMYSSPDEPWYS